MKKFLTLVLFATFLTHGEVMAADIQKLPEPDLKQSSPALMELINSRQSVRSYDKSKLVDDKTLSEILWVAFGVNQYGKRTIATARNEQNLKVFVLREDGVWLYNGKENQLEKISDENAIDFTCEQQAFAKDAPVHLVYTSSDKRWGHDHAGSAYHNVYLYATAKGLATVIRGLVNFDELHRALKLSDDEFVIAHQPVGYAK
jgi:nitroreductase